MTAPESPIQDKLDKTEVIPEQPHKRSRSRKCRSKRKSENPNSSLQNSRPCSLNKNQDRKSKPVSLQPQRKRSKSTQKDGTTVTGDKIQKKRKKPTRRMSTGLVFVMKQHNEDPQAKLQRTSEKKMSKLIRYIKRYWQVHVDKKFYPTKIDFRMLDGMTHQRPDNWWLLKRARQKMVEHSGFFSNVREPYHDLGPPELDSALLILKNMHNDLLVNPAKWIEDRQIKEEIMRKCNAPLEKLPRTRVRRPLYSKGHVKVGAGGILTMNRFVQNGYDFQNRIRGGVVSYSQTIDNFMERLEMAKDMASAFGVVQKGKTTGPHKSLSSARASEKQTMEEDDDRHFSKALSDVMQNSSAVDDRAYQRTMLNFERMMVAIYNIVRSLLNMKPAQLQSDFALTSKAVLALRSKSPPTKLEKHRIPISTMIKCKKSYCSPRARVPKSVSLMISDNEEETEYFDEDEEEEEEEEDEGFNEDHFEMLDTKEEDNDVRILMDAKSVRSRINSQSRMGSSMSIPNLHPGICSPRRIDVSHVRKLQLQELVHENPSTVINEIKVAHQNRMRDIKSAKRMTETPEMNTSRLIENEEQYNKLFHHGHLTKDPLWRNIDIKNIPVVPHKSHAEGNELKDKVITTFSAEDFPFASVEKVSIPSTPKIPHMADIQTPTFPGLMSPPAVNSDEQSQLDLLARNPEAAKASPPPTPIAHLFEVSGLKTTEKQMFNTLLSLKKKFQSADKALRFYYTNETEKSDWGTLNRFQHKIRAIEPCPVYEQSIATMRKSMHYAIPEEDAGGVTPNSERRTSLWYRRLKDMAEEMGASRHLGCAAILMKLYQYCDVDMKSRPKMLSRFCLLIVSLPITELGTRPWQQAVKFMLNYLLGMPMDFFHQWLDHRGLPLLI